MVMRDRLGYIHEVPDRQYIGAAHPSDQAQIVYDGFGDPVGFAFLAPLLPLLAKGAAALLPAVTSLFTSSPRPAAAPPPPTIPRPLPMPQALPMPRPLPATATPPQIIVIREPSTATPLPSMPPAQAPPTVVLRPRRLRRRRAPVRLRVERMTEQMVVPPPVMLRPRPPIVTAESSRAAPLPPATESSGGMSDWYPAQFGNYF
jgi:hypothetical protein